MSESRTVVFDLSDASKQFFRDLFAAAPKAAAASGAAGGAVIPFGRSKGRPVAGAASEDLLWVGERVVQSLGDPAREKFKGENERLLAAINAELARQGHPPLVPSSDEIAF